jgi:hypothetical protein
MISTARLTLNGVFGKVYLSKLCSATDRKLPPVDILPGSIFRYGRFLTSLSFQLLKDFKGLQSPKKID